MQRFGMSLILASTLALAACNQAAAPAPMSLADARANLVQVVNGDPRALCTDEGRTEFRRAVRAFSAAAVAEDADAPSAAVLADDEAWRMIVLGVMARVVEPSDLQGEARALPMMYGMPGGYPQFDRAHDAFQAACPEFMAFYAEAIAFQRINAEIEAAGNRSERAQARLHERADRQMDRMQRAAENLQRRLSASGLQGPDGASLRRPG